MADKFLPLTITGNVVEIDGICYLFVGEELGTIDTFSVDVQFADCEDCIVVTEGPSGTPPPGLEPGESGFPGPAPPFEPPPPPSGPEESSTAPLTLLNEPYNTLLIGELQPEWTSHDEVTLVTGTSGTYSTFGIAQSIYNDPVSFAALTNVTASLDFDYAMSGSNAAGIHIDTASTDDFVQYVPHLGKIQSSSGNFADRQFHLMGHPKNLSVTENGGTYTVVVDGVNYASFALAGALNAVGPSNLLVLGGGPVFMSADNFAVTDAAAGGGSYPSPVTANFSNLGDGPLSTDEAWFITTIGTGNGTLVGNTATIDAPDLGTGCKVEARDIHNSFKAFQTHTAGRVFFNYALTITGTAQFRNFRFRCFGSEETFQYNAGAMTWQRVGGGGPAGGFTNSGTIECIYTGGVNRVWKHNGVTYLTQGVGASTEGNFEVGVTSFNIIGPPIGEGMKGVITNFVIESG